MNNERKYKMGLQLYTIRDAMNTDARDTLKKVRALGYEDLEVYGFDGDKDSYYGFKSPVFKKILDDLGLTTTSGHYGLQDYYNSSEEELIRYVDQCISGAWALEQDYITWPWLDPQFRNEEGFKRLTPKLNKIGERVTKAGLGFAYHNHGFEFEDLGGKNGYDIILSETDPKLVKLQLDFYWVIHSSKDGPAEIIARQPERYVMWHIKDMDKETRDYTELGNGSIDYSEILPKVDKSGLKYYYLEQGGNFEHNSMQSITDSAAFFQKHLRHYIG
ncbi:sugar phosphate isomerase/epimerase family protein [Poritiphilus flavus]|uniref:TIM barrel protein n=1 Tax=Poritiphilus flavus TaxID=2697053 RepID=A0A6L9EFC8_9FLAO|nr:sugar phosphate isomerase/epimerase [Poritiphilus flavus]NAS13282.1 TIM barrel protein [Poritiphilus flavus]